MEEYRTRTSGIRLFQQKFHSISQSNDSERIIFRDNKKLLYKEIYFPSNDKLRLRLKYGHKQNRFYENYEAIKKFIVEDSELEKKEEILALSDVLYNTRTEKINNKGQEIEPVIQLLSRYL